MLILAAVFLASAISLLTPWKLPTAAIVALTGVSLGIGVIMTMARHHQRPPRSPGP